jgi:DNA-binding transcriptional regulator LsrR (DeoR family)
MTSKDRFGGAVRRLDGRNGEIARRYYLMSQSQQEIADDLGISQSRVSQVLRDVRSEIDATTREDVKADIAARLAQLRAGMVELVEMEGAPVTAGKDGQVVTDPETGAVVRDYALRVNATRTVIDIERRLAALYGADEPARLRTDLTVSGMTEQAAQLAAEAREALDPDQE